MILVILVILVSLVAFALGGHGVRIGKHTFSLRYDQFTVEGDQPLPLGNQSGHATALADVYVPSGHWRVTLEGVRVRSAQSNRALWLGEAPFATESVVQLAVRYAIGSR